MYSRTYWQDHVTTYENKYTKTDNEDGTITLIPNEGEIIQKGTPQSAKYFNNIETGIFGVTEFANEIFRILLNLIRKVDNKDKELKKIENKLEEQLEKIEVDLTNTLNYPFNNSKKTVSFLEEKNSTNYEVDTYCDNKKVGKIVISDKQKNGFKIEYTGGAKSAKIRCYVRGGKNAN